MTPEFQSRIAAATSSIIHGWCSPEKAVDLAAAILRIKSSVTVEIGVWGGRSLIPMALAHKEQNHGEVWAIDPWSAQASAEGELPANADWWGKQNHETIYRYFTEQLKIHDVEKYVKVFRAKSDDVVPPPVIDLLHVDGNHSAQAIKDMDRFASKVRPGGYVFADDVHWGTGAVEKAVALLVSMGFIHVAARDTGGLFIRPLAGAPKVVDPIPAEPTKIQLEPATEKADEVPAGDSEKRTKKLKRKKAR